ncbi:MAG: NifB/NifX family molybdenum-iron cluster-binding protein [Acidobacteriota bacterium]
MKKIRLCIGTNDEKNIADSHMGDTEIFHIYDIFESAEKQFVAKRINNAKDMEHDKVDKMKKILEIVKDSDVLVAGRKSPNFVNIAKKTKYQPVIVKTKKIPAILDLISQKFSEIDLYVAKRQNGEIFEDIPVF